MIQLQRREDGGFLNYLIDERFSRFVFEIKLLVRG
jgi:hypothetical protein